MPATPTTVIVVSIDALDCATAPDVASKVERCVLASDAEAVLLDLSHVTFMDASGIGAIVGLNNRLTASGRGTVRVTEVSPTVRRVFALTRMTAMLA